MTRLIVEIQNEYFKLVNPKSISREILLDPELKMPGAFYLPDFSTSTLISVERGDSCNVDIHSYTPHNLTHIETSSHITSNGATLNQIPRENFSGLLFLIDLSNLDFNDSSFIQWDDIELHLEKLKYDVKILGIKTKYSLQSQYSDFSGKNPIALNPNTMLKLREHYPQINLLILDLPSMDAENDGGKLLAHRNYFGIPEVGMEITKEEYRSVVELAYYNEVASGYYYCIFTPPLIQTNAAITDIRIYELKKVQD